MRAALTRTQPRQRSCEVRLALANWLHGRLDRSELVSDDLGWRLQLQRYRSQVAFLRATLRSQVS